MVCDSSDECLTASPQVGHLLAFAQAQTGDRALPLVTQTMRLLRAARLAALYRPRPGDGEAPPPPAPPLHPPRPRAPKASRTTACGLVVRRRPWHELLLLRIYLVMHAAACLLVAATRNSKPSGRGESPI